MRLTFRQESWSGRYRIDHYPAVARLNGVDVLTFFKTPESKIGAKTRINKTKEEMQDTTAPCPWKWVTLMAQWDTMDDAKTYIRQRISTIFNMLCTDLKEEIQQKEKK